MALTLSVGGVNRDVLSSSVHIRRSTNGVATLECVIKSDGSYRPQFDDEVIMWKDAVREFGGLAVDIREGGILGQPTSGIMLQLSAQGYAVRATRAVVQGLYPAGTLKSKVIQLLADTTNPLPGITLYVSQSDGPTLPEQTYDYVNTQDVLDEWSLQSGWPHVIDESAVLRFVEPGTLSAPFNVSNANVASTTVNDMTVQQLRTEYYNRVIVRAGTVTSIREDPGSALGTGLVGTAVLGSAPIAAHEVYALVVHAPPETTQAGADQLARMYLSRSLPELKRVAYSTYLDGVAPGQSQTITLSARDVNNTFLITDVTTTVDVDTRLRRHVKAVEGLVYKGGWREQFKSLIGGRGGITSAGFVGAGPTTTRFAYFLGGSGVDAVGGGDSPAWVPASDVVVQVNTIPRGTLSASVFVQLRSLNEAVSVKARIFDITANQACAGESATVTSTTFQFVTFTSTLTAGSHLYRLELWFSTALERVMGVGYLE